MIDLSQKINVKVWSKNFEHFKKLGYNVKRGKILQVGINELPSGATQKIKVICDLCHNEYEVIYKNIVLSGQLKKKNYCKHCVAKATMLDLYGVESALALPAVQKKVKKTKALKYGDDFQKKQALNMRKSVYDKYGTFNPCQVKEINKKRIDTVKKKYGSFSSFTQSESAKKKREKTCIEKYGCKTVVEAPEIRKKIRETSIYNDSTRYSSQQIKIFKILQEKYKEKVFLNYPFNSFVFDIALFINDIKIDIEYDGWYWHKDQQRDRKRDEISKKYGWKILRIKSGHKVPTQEQLVEAIDKLVNGFSYTQIVLDDWKEEDVS